MGELRLVVRCCAPDAGPSREGGAQAFAHLSCTQRAQRVFKGAPWHEGGSFELVRVEQHGT